MLLLWCFRRAQTAHFQNYYHIFSKISRYILHKYTSRVARRMFHPSVIRSDCAAHCCSTKSFKQIWRLFRVYCTLHIYIFMWRARTILRDYLKLNTGARAVMVKSIRKLHACALNKCFQKVYDLAQSHVLL